MHHQVHLLKKHNNKNKDLRVTKSKSGLKSPFGMTFNRLLIFENPPIWLNLNNSPKKSEPEFLLINVKDSLPIITNA